MRLQKRDCHFELFQRLNHQYALSLLYQHFSRQLYLHASLRQAVTSPCVSVPSTIAHASDFEKCRLNACFVLIRLFVVVSLTSFHPYHSGHSS